MVYQPVFPVIAYTCLALGVLLLVADAVTVVKVIRGSRSTFALVLLGYTLAQAFNFIAQYFAFSFLHTEKIFGGFEVKFTNEKLGMTNLYLFYYLSL